MLFLYLDQEGIKSFYSKKESVHEVLDRAWYIFLCFTFFDSLQTVASGVITGLGLMPKVKLITLVTYIIIGIPISLYLMFPLNMGIEGLWYGPTVSCVINYFIY